MPAGLTDLLQLPPVLRGAIKGILREPFQPRGLWSDETIHSFVSRRFGDHVARNVVGGIVSGIYGGDVEKLSMRSCFPRLWDMESGPHGSILKTMLKGGSGGDKSKVAVNLDPALGVVPGDTDFVHDFSKAAQVSFVRGLEQLTMEIEQNLLSDDRVRIVRGDPAVELVQHAGGGGGASVRLASGEMLESSHVFSTLPSSELGSLLVGKRRRREMGRSDSNGEMGNGESDGETGGGEMISEAASNILLDMEACDIGVVNMSFDDSSLIERPGFGYLVPSSEGENILGVSFDSCIFPEQEAASAERVPAAANGSIQKKSAVVCVMIGGVHASNVREMDDEDLLREAKAGLSKHLKIDPKRVAQHLTSHEVGVMKDCIPQYRVGHFDRVKQLENILDKDVPSLTILGTSFYGVGLADSVSKAKEIAGSFRMV